MYASIYVQALPSPSTALFADFRLRGKRLHSKCQLGIISLDKEGPSQSCTSRMLANKINFYLTTVAGICFLECMPCSFSIPLDGQTDINGSCSTCTAHFIRTFNVILSIRALSTSPNPLLNK
jgi:hypothetical protein